MSDPGVAPDAPDPPRRFLTFRTDNQVYAVPLNDISEVIRTPKVARTPLAPPALIGIANLRGSIAPVVSLRGLLGLKDIPDQASRTIVLDREFAAALVIDDIPSLLQTSANRIEMDGGEQGSDVSAHTLGSFLSESGEAVKILDLDALLRRGFADRPRPTHRGAERAQVGWPRNAPSETAAAETLVTFEVADQEYAFALSDVREIISAPESVTQMPRAEAIERGVIAYREGLLPLFSLRALLGLPPASSTSAHARVVVTEVQGAVVGLIVDRTREIVSAEPRLTEPVPAILAARSGGEARLSAIYRGDGGRRLISILSSTQLFAENVVRRLPSASAKSLTAASAKRPFLVFHLGEDEFGLPIEAVDEVSVVPQRITRLPRTPDFLEGVANLHGEVLPIIDQRRRFDMASRDGDPARRLIVMRTEGRRAGLIVDRVSEVRRCAVDAIEPPPALSGEMSDLVLGVINLVDLGRIILLLDPHQILSHAERGLLEAFESQTKASS